MAGLLKYVSGLMFDDSQRAFVETINGAYGVGLRITMGNVSLEKLMRSDCHAGDEIDIVHETRQTVEEASRKLSDPDDVGVISLGNGPPFAIYRQETEILELNLAPDLDLRAEGKVRKHSMERMLEALYGALDQMESNQAPSLEGGFPIKEITVKLVDEGPDGLNLVAHIGGSILTTTVKMDYRDDSWDETPKIIADFNQLLADIDDPKKKRVDGWYHSWPEYMSYNKPKQTLRIAIEKESGPTTHDSEYRIKPEVLKGAFEKALHLLQDL